MERIFTVCAPGLEPFTAQELRSLGLLPTAAAAPAPSEATSEEDESGGIEFDGELEAVYRANLHLRTASRVLVRFGSFHAAAFSELHKRLRKLEWERFVRPGQPLALRVTCYKSRLYHSAAVGRELVKAVSHHLEQESELVKFDDNAIGPLPQLIVVRLVNDECAVSIDSSGALLHRRGYRLATAKAPLRETLAAGMLLASGWDGRSPLLDPFCGSGTIPIEAALLAQGVAPGHARRFAFMDWPGYVPEAWETLLVQNRLSLRSDLPPIQASDRDAGAIAMAQANAERAGVGKLIEFSHRAVSAVEPQGVGWVVTNPPYGLRVSANKDLRNLYAQFGHVLRLKCPGWQVAVLCSEMPLLQQMGLRLDTSLGLNNGGVPVRVGRGTVPA